ncbi:hypothetical protein [Lysobacter changpingensis]|uniref:hypothetical protein n=1 Tax=Lysobacter changpingensis TaxID=2792784 RepID=UPI001A8CD146|nr:hypothetical protein [Lysobacter changpingensis]
MTVWTTANRQEEERLLKIYRDLSTRDKLRVRGYAEAIAAAPAKPIQSSPVTLVEFLAGLIGRVSWAR